MIIIKNDMKESYQSFSAKIVINLTTTMGDASMYLEGLGRDEVEARKELKNVMERLMLEYEKQK